MKKLLFLLIIISSCLTCRGEITELQALSMVQNSVPQDRLTTSDFLIGEKDASTWLVFEDLCPNADWGHPAIEYYLPKTLTTAPNKIKSAEVTMPPVIPLWKLEGAKRIPPRPVYDNFRDVIVPKKNIAPANHQYALLISGGCNVDMNHIRYWNNLSYAYRVLRNQFNVPKSNIYVACSNGCTDEPDMYGDVRSPIDLDNDRYPDIGYAATLEEIRNIFSELANTLTENDHLFIYVTDHGDKATDGRGSSICLWGNDYPKLYANEFASLLKKIKCASKNILMAQCFSGGFVDFLKDQDNVVIATASSKDQVNNMLPDCSSFLEEWINALWKTSEDADTDGDGNINMNEAFVYARDNQFYRNIQTPQFYSSHANLAKTLSFSYLPAPVNLCIRDDYNDYGGYNSVLQTWSSPDIALSSSSYPNMADTELSWNSITKAPNYVKVRIHNKGWKPYITTSNAPIWVEAYWCNPGLIGSIPYYIGNMIDSKGVSLGGKIGKIQLSENLYQDDYTVVTIPWTYENRPLNYTSGPVNILVTVGSENCLHNLIGTSNCPTDLPYIAERHRVGLNKNQTSTVAYINLGPGYKRQFMLSLESGNPDLRVHINSPDLFGDTDNHTFDSDNLIKGLKVNPSQVDPIKLTIGYSFANIPGSLEVGFGIELKEYISKARLGRYIVSKPFTPSVDPPIILSETYNNGSYVELVAETLNEEEYEFEWVDSMENSIALGQTYHGTKEAIVGGTLKAHSSEVTFEIPVQFSSDELTFEIVEKSSKALTLRASQPLDKDIIIERTTVGQTNSQESAVWGKGTQEIVLDLSSCSGFTVISVIVDGEQILIDKILI
ncbi:MAG: hypothetical protein HDS14_07170 [Bacteroides sp.]|nr:hypothetical protein [Bacteroides sp.]